MQTYVEYLETMKSYNFYPLDFDTWKDWQIHYHGCYKTDKEK